MHNTSSLQQARLRYRPPLPRLLTDIHKVCLSHAETPLFADAELKALFPHIFGRPLLVGKAGAPPSTPESRRVGVVLSGGQAAGGHNVITGLFDALKLLHPDSRLFGFLDGPAGILNGKVRELTAEGLQPYRNQGGFDLIGSGRTKIETQEQLTAALATMKKEALDGLVVIGGDDSNTNAALLAEYFLAHGCGTTVVGVPKTIDGDLKNPYVATSFGFDTACKVYAEMIGNIARDALSAKKYTHFIKLMGRSASHIALECALAVQPNLTLIGEEVAAQKKTLQQITHEIADLICMRAEKGKNFGVILIPEGLIEFIPEMGVLISELNGLLALQEHPSVEAVREKLTPASRECFQALPEAIQKQLLLNRDPHGNVQVSLIETEKLLIDTVTQELQRRELAGSYRGKFSPLHHFFGYEGRAAYPSNFDCNYCYVLGYAAALLVQAGATAYMSCVRGLTRPVAEWQIGGVPLTLLMRMEMRKAKRKPVIEKALVDLNGRAFKRLQQEQKKWALEDLYRFPGPLQFYGDPEVTEALPISVVLEQS